MTERKLRSEMRVGAVKRWCRAHLPGPLRVAEEQLLRTVIFRAVNHGVPCESGQRHIAAVLAVPSLDKSVRGCLIAPEQLRRALQAVPGSADSFHKNADSPWSNLPVCAVTEPSKRFEKPLEEHGVRTHGFCYFGDLVCDSPLASIVLDRNSTALGPAQRGEHLGPSRPRPPRRRE